MGYGEHFSKRTVTGKRGARKALRPPTKQNLVAPFAHVCRAILASTAVVPSVDYVFPAFTGASAMLSANTTAKWPSGATPTVSSPMASPAFRRRLQQTASVGVELTTTVRCWLGTPGIPDTLFRNSWRSGRSYGPCSALSCIPDRRLAEVTQAPVHAPCRATGLVPSNLGLHIGALPQPDGPGLLRLQPHPCAPRSAGDALLVPRLQHYWRNRKLLLL